MINRSNASGERHTRSGQPRQSVTEVRGPDEFEESDWPTRKSTRGGSQSVFARDTIAAGGCWCGKKFGHDWPGKDAGAAHPRESE